MEAMIPVVRRYPFAVMLCRPREYAPDGVPYWFDVIRYIPNERMISPLPEQSVEALGRGHDRGTDLSTM